MSFTKKTPTQLAIQTYILHQSCMHACMHIYRGCNQVTQQEYMENQSLQGKRGR